MHNTWFSNIKKFRKGPQSINPLHMCRIDAEKRGLTNGEPVRVFNDYGSVETLLHIDDKLRSGAVAMAHGYGKGRAGMRVSESNPGANANQLAPNTMSTIEPLSNMSWISAYPVNVEKLIDAELDGTNA
jgi:anaerobic selenocysteine-containing dehydrogenase